MWLFLIATVLTAAGIPVYLRFQTGTGKNKKLSPVFKSKKKTGLKEVWDIEDIKHGVVVLSPGYRYRMVMRLASADFFLLSEMEQNQVEDALAATLMGLSFPVQFLVTSEAVDTRQAVQDVREKLFILPEKVRNYAKEYSAYLESLAAERTTAVRNAYAVVAFETEQGLEYARTELLARASSLAEGLQVGKIYSEILDTAALVDLLQHLLNRGRAWRPSEADAAGVMDSYIVSGRQVKHVA